MFAKKKILMLEEIKVLNYDQNKYQHLVLDLDGVLNMIIILPLFFIASFGETFIYLFLAK
jgi:hypothetical protein